jgi:phospholipid-translocating ATPase
LRDAKQKLQGVDGGGLILDGTFTKFVLLNQEAKEQLYELAIGSKACVCCRLSPQQKRKLVELVKEQNKQGITLAIGDGANDVSMIQGAHIGIGVRGKEGNQAVQASDIAISQFRFLGPLLFCHGRRAYRRVALFLCYYIYKHVVLVIGDMIWAHQFKFRGEIAYPEWLSSAYSLLFTSLPVMVILGFDTDVPDSVAMSDPSLYSEGLDRIRFNFKIFTTWMISGLWHGALAWSVPSIVVGTNKFTLKNNDPDDVEMDEKFWISSCTSFTLVIFFVELRLWMVALNRLSVITIGVLAVSILLYFVVLFGLGEVMPSMQPQIEGIPSKMVKDGNCLLCIFLTPLALLVDLIFFEGSKKFFPTPLDKARAGLRSMGAQYGKAKPGEPQIVKPATAAW